MSPLPLRSVAIAAVVALGVSLAACSSAPPAEQEAVASSSDELTTAEAVSRAEAWCAVKLHYCQAPNGQRDYDAACSTYCNRYSNPQWDPYRSDCSGLVSWAWALPAPGRVTGQFAPFQTDISSAIPAIELRAGDAVNNSEHIMLFKEWTVPGKSAVFIEEPGCSSSKPYAHELASAVTVSGTSISVSVQGSSYTAIRYKNLQLPNAAARGFLDSAACGAIAGWAQDPDSADAAVGVDLSFDAPIGKPGSGSMHITASDHRDDLCKAIGSCNHGFAVPVPAGLRDGKAHSAYAFASDVQTGESALLADAPKSFKCAALPIPAGIKRHVLSPAAMTAWQFDSLQDVAPEPLAAVAAVPSGPDFDSAPVVVKSDDGTPSVWVIDGGMRRHVLNATSLAAWKFAVKAWPATKVSALPQGLDWPLKPFVMQGQGAPAIYVVDAAPASPDAPASPSLPEPAAASDASGEGGCNAAGHGSNAASPLVLGLALIALRKRSRKG